MQKYLGQLIGAIRQATHDIRPPNKLWDHVDINSEGELEDMAFLEKYFEGEVRPISDITGIHAMLLPLPEPLNEEEKVLLCTELERLLQHHNFYLDFPDQLPAHLKYPVIFDFWKEEQVAVSFGKNQIELCDMEKENCPFPGYCKTCDEVEAQMKYDEEMQKRHGTDEDVELPF